MEHPIKSSHSNKLSADAKILVALLGAGKPLTYSESAKLSRVNVSTVYRYMPLMLNERIVAKMPCSLAFRINRRPKEECVILNQELAKKLKAEWGAHDEYIRHLKRLEERKRNMPSKAKGKQNLERLEKRKSQMPSKAQTKQNSDVGMNLFCRGCGAENRYDEAFCRICNQPL